MAPHVPYRPFEARAQAVAERLTQLRQRRDELRHGRSVDAHDVVLARRRATNAAVMSAAAHDRLVEHHQGMSITDPQHADAHRSAALAHRGASDTDLRAAFGDHSG